MKGGYMITLKTTLLLCSLIISNSVFACEDTSDFLALSKMDFSTGVQISSASGVAKYTPTKHIKGSDLYNQINDDFKSSEYEMISDLFEVPGEFGFASFGNKMNCKLAIVLLGGGDIPPFNVISIKDNTVSTIDGSGEKVDFTKL
jgi:hypothetical protein